MMTNTGKNIISILQRDPSTISDSIIVAQYLLCLHKEDLLPEFSAGGGLINSISQKLSGLPEYFKDQLHLILSFIDYGMTNLHHQNLNYLVEGIREINGEGIKSTFYYLLKELERNQKGLIFESELVAELLVKFADVKTGSKVLNPYGRTGAIDMRLNDVTLKSIHDNHRTIQILYRLRSIIEGKWDYESPNEIRYRNSQNSISDEMYLAGGQFDYIISDIPLGRNLEDQRGGYAYVDAATITIAEGINKLTESGEIIISSSYSFGTSGRKDELQLRERLVNDNLIDTIIYLPNTFTINSNASILIFRIKRGRSKGEGIKMVDASSYLDTKSKQPSFDIDGFIKDIDISNDISNDISKMVTAQEVEENRYILDPRRYLVKATGIKLRNYLSPITGQGVSDESKPLVICTKDLSDIGLSVITDKDEFTPTIRKKHYKEVDTPCLLVSRIAHKTKMAFCTMNQSTIRIDNDVMAFKLNEDIKPDYHFFSKFYEESFNEQLKAYSTGATIPRINTEDFLDLRIEYNPNEDNRGIDHKSEIGKIGIEVREYLHNKDEAYYTNIASLNHSLGTARQNILSSANIISNYLNTHKDDEVVNQFLTKFREDNNYNFEELSVGIRNDIGFISRTLKYGFEGLKLENYEKEPTLISSIPKLISDLYRPAYYFELRMWNEISIDSSFQVNINLDLFKILISNIFENAHKHGFRSKSESNVVTVEVFQVLGSLTIGIVNNGTPFPKDFTQEQFEQKYTSTDSTSTGMGGYDVKRIIEYFGGNYALLFEGMARQSVEFLINIPLLNPSDEEVQSFMV